MAAYTALVSLMNTMDHIQDHPHFSNCFDKKQMESLSHHLSFLLDFVEIPHSHGVLSNEDEVLESQIASAAYAAEDVIESHVVDRIHSGSLSLLELKKVIQDMVSVKDKVATVKEGGRFKDRQHGPTYSSAPTSSTPVITNTRKSKMVGFDKELFQLLDALTGQQSSLRIIPIVGMGGIGKTTLARNAYESRLILDHFDIHAWVTISQEYSVREIFSKLLSPESTSGGDLNGESEHELTQAWYQSLIGRRYLVVLDDVWSIDVWEKINSFFPVNNNGSRIVLTTRLSNVAVYFGLSYFQLKLMDEDKSWKLFGEHAFLQEGCPPELEEIGKKIAKKCKGLPLLIVVIGGLLRKSSRSQELWENISKDINLIPNLREEEQNLDILSLSYRHLSVHLKPCFLYMGIFPGDRFINVSQLIKLWVSEGFIKPNETQSMEEVAEGYFKDLVDRNLLLVRLSLPSRGKIKSCSIHDLLRDLCIKAAQKEGFFHVMRFYDTPRDINKERRILFQEKLVKVKYNPLLSHTLESASLTRSLLRKGGRVPFKFRLLRVSNAVDSYSDSDGNGIFKQVNLRYVCELGYICRVLPSTMSLLWNVQSLKISGIERFVAPYEIWSMLQLRHLEFSPGIYLPEPPLKLSQENDDGVVLKNLQTLSKVVNLKLSEEVCKRIPNVKKLKIVYDGIWKSSFYNHLYNIARLHKLESLTCHFDHFPQFSASQILIQLFKCIACPPPQLWGNLLRNLKFPTSLKKLSLSGGDLDWEDLTAIGSLPNLQVLVLEDGAVGGSKWDPVEGEFLRLKYLFIRSLELKYWNAESDHFPVLEGLDLKGLWKLDEIPSGIGDIPTLRYIQLFGCGESAAISARRILEEQESLGNDDLRVHVHFVWKE